MFPGDYHDNVNDFVYKAIVIKLHRMHEMQTIVTDVRGVCLSVCHECTE